MKNRIRKNLTNLAAALAAKTFSCLYDDTDISVSFFETREKTEAFLVNFIRRLADIVETEDISSLDRESKEFAFYCSNCAVRLSYVLKSIRTCRDIIVDEMNKDTSSLLYAEREQKEFLIAQLLIFKAADHMMALIEKVFHQTDQGQAVEDTLFIPSHAENIAEVAEQELVQLVLQSSDIAVLMINRDLTVIEANHALSLLVGAERNQVIGKNIDAAFRPHDSERFLQWVVEKGQSGHYVAEYNGKWTTVSTSPIYHKGELWGAIGVLRNITESKRYEEELSKREALAAVGQLAAGMAHEIRNPLTSIKGFIQLLREQGESSRNDSYFSVILTEIERIDGLLNDVLVLARYRDDNIVSERFLLLDELYGVFRLLEPEANRRGINLELQLAQGEWHVFGHRPRIKQAILNILKNSFEALLTKGNLVLVTVFASINEVVITVEDNGPGLSEVCKQNLFVPFYTTKQEGTGLGLSTTQRIIVDHGGEIYADNSPKLHGARFEIRLPLSRN
ncbi:two-component system sensor histidine kinase NtrB [Brevibacillus sp. NRS-1366]|uniref:two-component system sensor histidine kinase NtrB n=1 Tax=Brevibacillus sp. NRS-1366 TaxID=3233899 RepID=UPI003D22A92D